MKAMLLRTLGALSDRPQPLSLEEVPLPEPGPGEVRIAITACGVCHTELDEIEGRTPPPVLPVIPGHQVVGRVDRQGPGTKRFQPGDRVGVAWIHAACGGCEYCRRGDDNLCPDFKATGRDAHGGYAEAMVVGEKFAFPLPDGLTDVEAAPLLCAGAIGYRSLKLTGLENGQSLGLTGFGASGHLVCKLVRHLWPDTAISVFARSAQERAFALALGAAWAGPTEDTPPAPLDAIIDTTPVWKPVVEGLRNLKPGGRLVINAIRKEPVDKDYLLNLDYAEHLWMEKEIKSVANVAASDVKALLGLAAAMSLKPETQTFPLAQANQALGELKARKIRGAKVLTIC